MPQHNGFRRSSSRFLFAKSILMGLSSLFALQASAATLADRLGFEAGAKVLIMHADDMGSIGSANHAIEDVLNYGLVRAASIMMTCPAAPEAIQYALAHPEADLGVHITLTSEWKNYRWGPTLPANDVPSLVERDEDLRPSLLSLFIWGHKPDVAREMESQIRSALATGWHPTHFDTHMGSAYLHPGWFGAYLNLGRKYHIPPMAPKWSEDLKEHYGFVQGGMMSFIAPRLMKEAEDAGYLLLDYLIDQPFPKENTFASRKQAYLDIIHGLKPGVTEVLFHPAYADDDFQKSIMSSNPDTVLRDWEAHILQDPDVKAALEAENIHLIGWRSIQKAYNWDQVQEVHF